jgi:hypothetical protein
LKDLLAAKLSLPVAAFDPFENVQVGPELRSHPPDAPGRFAPLLGLLLDEASQTPHAIDFLHPRQKPVPPNRRRTVVLGAAVAATLLLVVAGYVWLLFADLAAEKARLGADLRRLEQESKAALKSIERMEEIERWTRGDVVWLDELYELSDEMPSADEAIVEHLQAGSRSEGGGLIVLDGLVNEWDVVGRMEQQLRDDAHRVNGKGSYQDDSHPDYGWRYHETIVVQNAEDRRAAPKTAKPDAGPEDDSAESGANGAGDSSSQSTTGRQGGTP